MPASEEKLAVGIRVRAFTRQDGVVILGGLLAGLLGSIAFLIVASIGALASGEGAVFPLQLIATTAFGPPVAHEPPSASIVATGLLIHLLVGAGFGVLFGYFADALRPPTLRGRLVAGTAYGIALYLCMFLYVVPALAPLFVEQSWLAAAVAHIAYGASLSLYWPITERLQGRDADIAPTPLPVV